MIYPLSFLNLSDPLDLCLLLDLSFGFSTEEAFYTLLIPRSTQQLVSYRYAVSQLQICLTFEIRADDLDSVMPTNTLL